LTEFTNPSIDAPEHGKENEVTRTITSSASRGDGSGNRFIASSTTVTTMKADGSKVEETDNTWSDGEQETIIITTKIVNGFELQSRQIFSGLLKPTED